MPFFYGLKAATRELLGSSSLEDWPSFLENSPGGTMRPLFHASLLERIVRFSLTARGLAVICIWWIAFLLGLVFVFTKLTLWETPQRAYAASSTAALRLASDSDGSTDRKQCFSALPLCDDWRSYSEDGPLSSELKAVCRHDCAEAMTWNS